eukprot:TRINITY_DN217_c0_g1_i1.p1 TRINITY_DN217_c0_g1~~TRINITY_DN217_c0_g1_i1.p1  ORF type:complete len:429 (+),score=148.56 TRINITY_DN217_c0_g1_i1:38-1288(+)
MTFLRNSIAAALMVALVVVSCAAENAQTGTTDSPQILYGTTLTYGSSYVGSVGFAGITYYSFTATSATATVSVTSLSYTGLVTLFVAYNEDATINNYNFTAQSPGEGEDVSLELDNLNVGGMYSVAVYGFEATSSYTITLTGGGGGGNGTGTTLTDGVLFDGTLYDVTPDYYTFNISNLLNFQLNANSVNGLGHAHTFVGLGYQPTESNYDYASEDVNTGDACIYVENPTDGQYFVMVVEQDGGETMPYTIELDENTQSPQCTASVVTYPVLSDGVPVNASLDDLTPNYYTFYASSAYSNFQINSNSENGGGHAHVYMSLGQVPTTTSYDYASADVGNGDACIYVENPAYGTYYIEVIEYQGGEVTPYQITANSNVYSPLCTASTTASNKLDDKIIQLAATKVEKKKVGRKVRKQE